MKARCEKCHQLFEFNPISDTIGEYEITYFECDCGRRWFISITNDKIRKRLDRTESIKKLRQQQYIQQTRKMMKSLEQEQQELISEVISPRTQTPVD